MKINSVSYSLGKTINLGSYESGKVQISAEASIDENESPDEVLDQLREFVLKNARREINEWVL